MALCFSATTIKSPFTDGTTMNDVSTVFTIVNGDDNGRSELNDEEEEDDDDDTNNNNDDNDDEEDVNIGLLLHPPLDLSRFTI